VRFPKKLQRRVKMKKKLKSHKSSASLPKKRLSPKRKNRDERVSITEHQQEDKEDINEVMMKAFEQEVIAKKKALDKERMLLKEERK
jgi:hypothetical protein